MSDTPIFDELISGNKVNTKPAWENYLEVAVNKYFDEGLDTPDDLRNFLEECINLHLVDEGDREDPDPDVVYDRIKDQESGL